MAFHVLLTVRETDERAGAWLTSWGYEIEEGAGQRDPRRTNSLAFQSTWEPNEKQAAALFKFGRIASLTLVKK